MRRVLIILCFLGLPSIGVCAQADLADTYRSKADSLIQLALADSSAYERLAVLCDTFGSRFSGSASLEAAIDWIEAEMRRDQLDQVRTETVMVPHWVRGEESAEMLMPRKLNLPMLGLGGSVGTGPGGIAAEVMVVSSFEDLEARTPEAEGKIVLFNVPFTSYGRTVAYRSRGASAAEASGAVAALIRSVGPFGMKTPHTGAMRYAEGDEQIPAAAITSEHADLIQRLTDRGERVTVRLNMSAQSLPDVESRNVMAEVTGWEYPEEVVVVGGHIDSWDVGQGAMDDAGGSVAAWEAVRLLKRLGWQPRRTVRVVLWTNEENGLRGGTTYKENLRDAIDDHVLAIESDSGVFSPLGFGFSGTDEAFDIISEIGSLLESVGSDSITKGGGGADIGPLMAEGVPGMGLRVDGEKYFWYHHTDADTVDKLDPAEVARCVATLAVMAFVVADMEQRLPRRVG